MSDQLKMSYQPSLLNLTDVISLQGSESGITHSPEPVGETATGKSGQAVALASLSPRQAKEMGLLTSGTYGLRGSTLLNSADLASSLASRYRAKTRSLGSTLFTLTWKVRYTPSQRPIFAVRASVLRISDRDCTSWPSPQTADENLSRGLSPAALEREWNRPNRSQNRAMTAQVLTNWRSPSESDGEGGVMEIRPETAGKYKLRDEAELANLGAWPSPMAGTSAQNGYNEAGNTDSSRKTVELVSWPTPKAQNAKRPGEHGQGGQDLQTMAQLTDFGNPPNGSIAATGIGVPSGQLNPGHSRWLMSLPPIWDVCGIRAAEIIRSRRSSKKAKAASPVSEATATP